MRSFLLWTAVFVTASMADLFTTLALYFQGVLDELNPIADKVLSYGWQYLILYKIFNVILVVSLVIFLNRRTPKTAQLMIMLAGLLVSIVAAWGFYLNMVIQAS